MNYFINESNLQNEKFPSLSPNNLKTKTISFIWYSCQALSTDPIQLHLQFSFCYLSRMSCYAVKLFFQSGIGNMSKKVIYVILSNDYFLNLNLTSFFLIIGIDF